MNTNKLRELRLSRKIPAKDMVAVIQRLYPKFDKTTISKCEHGDEYGVTLPRDAMEALYAEFAPERKNSRHGAHRLTCRVQGRLENDVYEALQQCLQADGYATVQDWITDMAQGYISKKRGDK